MMRNQYPGPCVKCRQRVAAGAGFRVRGTSGWTTYCEADAPTAVAPPRPTVRLVARGTDVLATTVGRLAGADFASYRDAVAIGRWDGVAKANRVPLDRAAELVTRLVKAGLAIDAAPEVTAAVRQTDDRARVEIDAAGARAAEVDALLRSVGKSLYPFQVEGVKWIAPRSAAILADDMGTGKTLQCLVALGGAGPVLVVAPAVAKGVWLRECGRWRKDLRPTVLDGRGSFRWPTAGELLVTNYDILPPAPLGDDELAEVTEQWLALVGPARDERAIENGVTRAIALSYREAGRWEPSAAANSRDWAIYLARQIASAALAPAVEAERSARLAKVAAKLQAHEGTLELLATCPAGVAVVADEAHMLKGSINKVARCASMRGIVTAARERGGRTWLVTATPELNDPSELWNLLQMIGMARAVFGSYDQFLAMCGGSRGRYGVEWSADARAIDSAGIRERLRDVLLRREKRDVLPQLPEKTHETLRVDVSRADSRELDKVARELKKLGIDSAEAASAALASKRISFETMSRAREVLARAKTAAALEVVQGLEEAGEPVVVFSAHRGPVLALAAREGWAAITGDTSPEQRTEIEDRFQRGELRGVAATIDAGGVAITLTRARYGLFVDRDWTPKLNEQAEDRLHRIGQNRGVIVTTLVADHPLDALVDAICQRKTAIVAATVDVAAVRADEVPARADAAALLDRTFEGIAAAFEAADAAARAQVDADIAEAKAATEDKRCKKLGLTERCLASAGRRGWDLGGAAWSTRRPARDEREEWIAQALATLAGDDPDYAAIENGVGFNKADAGLGHDLAAAVMGGLTDGEWRFALHLLAKYHRQVGRAPGLVPFEE